MRQTSKSNFLIETVGHAHQKWVKANFTATLADLRQFLEDVYEEFCQYDESEVIADHMEELGAAGDYLSEWADHPDDDEPATFGYREGNLDEDIRMVDDLIELVGESFKVSRLCRSKKRAVK